MSMCSGRIPKVTEHIDINKDGHGLKFIVTNMEHLGNESIVYGKLGDNLGEFTMKDEGNGIVVKVIDGHNFEVGDVVYAEPNPKKVHFFDAETEVTLMNKIPPYNSLEATPIGDKLSVLGTEVPLPEPFRKAIGDADKFELVIPPHAIVEGNDFRLKVAHIEKVDNERLAYLQNGDSYLFALVDDSVQVGDVYRFSLLNEKLSLNVDGEEVLKAVEDDVSLLGTFSKTEVKENHERVLHFFYNIGDYILEAAPECGYKINSIDGDNCYKSTYRYAIDRSAIRIAEDGEAGLDCRVIEYCDYGNIRFARVAAAGQEFLIKADP